MNDFTYSKFSQMVEITIFIAIAVMLVSLVAIIVRWKTLKRRGHVLRFVIALAAIPCLIGIPEVVLWLDVLPMVDRQQMAKYHVSYAEWAAATSVVGMGDAAPSFSLATIDGDEFVCPPNDSVALINFFTNSCGPCLVELSYIEQIWAAHKGDERFQLLIIGRGETIETVRHFREENGFTFPVAADPDREVYSLFAEELIPRTLVVSPAGHVVYSKFDFRRKSGFR